MELLEDWALIEASFQEQYGINLAEALPGMSWRRFLVLLSGLGPNSTFVTVRAHREQNPVIEDVDKAVAYVTSIFG